MEITKIAAGGAALGLIYGVTRHLTNRKKCYDLGVPDLSAIAHDETAKEVLHRFKMLRHASQEADRLYVLMVRSADQLTSIRGSTRRDVEANRLASTTYRTADDLCRVASQVSDFRQQASQALMEVPSLKRHCTNIVHNMLLKNRLL